MDRIIIIGSPGAGKSCFARKLRDMTGLPLYYLDQVYHKPDRTTVTREEFDRKLLEIMQTDNWIIDGNYQRTLPIRFEACTDVFFLDYPLEQCLEGAALRIGIKREDLPWIEEEFDPEFRQYILPEIMRRTFGTLPSFWSFIGDEYYDQAMQVIFGGYEETYAGIIEKANRYHNEVMAHTGDLINDSVANGVETYIVAKYGSRMVPIVKNADVQSDSTVTTANSSHGAATAPLYGSFSDDFVKGIQTANGGKYLSADHQIDASSCLLPDHTWLIKNLFHHENPDQVEKMIAAFFDYDGYMSVFDQEVYPQYLNYDRDTDSISPLSSDASASKAPKYSFFKSLIALIKLIITVLKNSR